MILARASRAIKEEITPTSRQLSQHNAEIG